MKKLFIEFLKVKGMYKLYVNNMYKLYVNNWKNVIGSVLKPIKKPRHYVSFAFSWSHTEEGYDFWKDLDTQWLEILKVLGK